MPTSGSPAAPISPARCSARYSSAGSPTGSGASGCSSSLYLVATAATALAWDVWSFVLFRFLTGAGIGGEYTAINSTIQELIPARYRGWTDLVINGSFWIGAALGAAARGVKLGNPNGARALRGKQGRQQGSRGLDQGAWKIGRLTRARVGSGWIVAARGLPLTSPGAIEGRLDVLRVECTKVTARVAITFTGNAKGDPMGLWPAARLSSGRGLVQRTILRRAREWW